MQKTFYASGFLFNPKLRKILLLKFQKNDNSDFLWSTIGGHGHEGEKPQEAYQRIVKEQLGLDLKQKNIYPVYDYFQDEKDEDNFVFYAEFKINKNFDEYKGNTYHWVSFDEISKLPFITRVKQDIIVGERVINAKWREDQTNKQIAITIQI